MGLRLPLPFVLGCDTPNLELLLGGRNLKRWDLSEGFWVVGMASKGIVGP